MTVKNYIKKNGFVYGVCSKFNYQWEHALYCFNNYEKAQEWIKTEGCDFRERELCSASKVKKIMGVSGDLEKYTN